MNKNGLMLLISLSCLPGSLFLHLVSVHLHGDLTHSIASVEGQEQTTSGEGAKIWFQWQGITISVIPHVVVTSSSDQYPERFVSDASLARLELAQMSAEAIDKRDGVLLSPVMHLELTKPRDVNQTKLIDQDNSLPAGTADSPMACEKNKQSKRRPLGRLLGL